ncbi:MAG: LapA family protein [Desulfuromonadaceae bacterium]|nr:LapA family protein [Desulfuromonadaceae bacterium]
MKFSLVAAIVLSLVMALFAVQNSQQAQVTFMGRYFDGPLVIILLIAFAVGVSAMLFAMLPGLLRKSIEISKLKSRVTALLSKVEALEIQLTNKDVYTKKEIGNGNSHHKS